MKQSPQQIQKDVISLAKSMPDFFTDTAIENIKQDAKNHPIITQSADGKIIGFLIYSACEDYVEIIWMGVDKNYRSKGIGKKMLRQLKASQSDRISFIKVITLAPREGEGDYFKTRKFYETNGFTKYKVFKNYPGWDAGNSAIEYRWYY